MSTKIADFDWCICLSIATYQSCGMRQRPGLNKGENPGSIMLFLLKIGSSDDISAIIPCHSPGYNSEYEYFIRIND